MNPKKNIFSIDVMVKIALFSAIAAVFTLLKTPLWFAPPFLKFDPSEAVVLLGAFVLGPYSALFIEIIKNAINFFIDGTTTAGLGEFTNFLIGCAFVLPAAFICRICRKGKSPKMMIPAIAVAVISMTAVASLLNAFVMLPLYSELYFDGNISGIIEMGTGINPAIVDMPTFIALIIVPFNLFKGIVSAIIAVVGFKFLSPVFGKGSLK